MRANINKAMEETEKDFKMISASEAKTLFETSESNFQRILKVLDAEVKRAASDGKASVRVTIARESVDRVIYNLKNLKYGVGHAGTNDQGAMQNIEISW
jgi:hypothetical protein